MNALEEMKRGEEAERLMNHPIFKEALEKIEGGIITAMNESGLGDVETHNKLVISLQILSQLKKHFKTVMDSGKMARITFEKESRIAQLKKAAGFGANRG